VTSWERWAYSGLAAVFVALFALFFYVDQADRKSEERITRDCIASGKTWSHNGNGWGECR